MIIDINKNNFEEHVEKGNTPIVLEFWASWCSPCKEMEPKFREASEEMEGVKFGRINVDENGDMAQKFGVMSIPALLLVRTGKVIAKTTGVKKKHKIKKWIEENL